MSKRLKYASLSDIPEPTLKWIEREGYEQKSLGVWRRPSKYFCRTKTGSGPVEVILTAFVEDDHTTFDMELDGTPMDYGTTVSVHGMDGTQLITRGRGIEHRMCDAWNDLNC